MFILLYILLGIRVPFNYISVSQNNQLTGASRTRNELPHVTDNLICPPSTALSKIHP